MFFFPQECLVMEALMSWLNLTCHGIRINLCPVLCAGRSAEICTMLKDTLRTNIFALTPDINVSCVEYSVLH